MGSDRKDCDVLILGAGFAGLAAGVFLAERGAAVTILERKPRLGGRAFSFRDPESGLLVDNGQHLFLAAYRETRRFLGMIGTDHLLNFSPGLRLDFVDSSGARDSLKAPGRLAGALGFFLGALGLKGLSSGEKAGLLSLAWGVRRALRGGEAASRELDRMTVREWLTSLGQSKRVQERLLDPIALAILNEDPARAAATGLAQALGRALFGGGAGARLGLSTVGLSDLYTEAAKRFIESRSGRVLPLKRVVSLQEDSTAGSGRSWEAVVVSGERFRAGAVISTLFPRDLSALDLPSSLRGAWEGLQAAPIVGISLRLDRAVAAEALVGLLGTEIHWAFNKSRIWTSEAREGSEGQYLALVISAAHAHLRMEPKELMDLARRDLSRCFPRFGEAKILSYKIVKEPYAALSPVPGSEQMRPIPGEAAPGFYLAGDWTRTGLPATIESAVLSARLVSDGLKI